MAFRKIPFNKSAKEGAQDCAGRTMQGNGIKRISPGPGAFLKIMMLNPSNAICLFASDLPLVTMNRLGQCD